MANEREDKNRLKDNQRDTYKFNEESENREHTPPEKGDAFSLRDKDSSESKELDMSVKADLPHGTVGHGALDMKNLPRSKPGWKVIFEELINDKLALFSLIILVIITSYVFGLTMFLNQAAIVKVDLFAINQPPNDDFRLGTDYGGRDIFGQLIIGTRNSLAIG
ncbi:MAG: ABC transporter permease, partial [Jeotgalicoccus sp.]|nr:ABC transporter permease [Jeotgalicoccus sp.]